MKSLIFILSSFLTVSRGATLVEIPFSYFDQHFIVVPVKINDSIVGKFVLDTGIGVNLISKSICEKLKCKIKGHHTGKRMSGQEITVPMSDLKSLSFGSVTQTEVPVGVFDMDQLMPGANIDGFLSLGFFKDSAFTVNYKKETVTLESPSTLEKIRSSGAVVSIQVDHEDVATCIHMPLILPNGTKIMAEVDTGSQSLILDEKLMQSLGIQVTAKDVRKTQGTDETGHAFNRYFTTLAGNTYLPDHPEMKIPSISVMFQKIIYDGLVGHFFLREFTVTYDLKHSQMIFRKP